MEETDDAGPSQRSPRTVHTFAVWAATRVVPTGELRRERSFRVGACGRRPLESADPGACVWVRIRDMSNRWSLVGNCGRGRGARGVAKKTQEMVVLCRKSKGSALWGRLRGRTCPRSGQRELQGGLLDTSWELRGVFLTPFWVKNSVLGVPVGSGVRFRS